ncbi:MAG TPA: hypothetical protein VGG03_21985 [Thermoanaerobaculia bacterium]
MTDHPTPAELEGFVWNRISPGRAGEVISHLVRGCAQCRAAVAPHLKGLFGLGEPPPRVLTPQEDAAYDAALDRAFAAVLDRAGRLREERKREALALLESSEPETVPEIPPHLQGIPLFEALLERSWSLRHENPREMVGYAQWAQKLADRLDPAGLDPRRLKDLQCRAWIELGNAYRVADDLAEAEVALGEAVKLYVEGTRDEFLAARLFTVQASLLGANRRFDLAETALDLVFTLHQRHGNKHLAGRALIMKAIFTGYHGDPQKAVRLIGEGLALVDEEQDPQLVFSAIQSQARFLVDCGCFRDARVVLFKLKARGLATGGRINELKIRWLEGQINAGLGELDRAGRALLEVKQGFEEAHLGYKAALAGLELGAVLLRQGKSEQAKREVLAAADVFIALKVQREARASVLLLRKAFERRLADAVLLDYVIGLLRRVEEAADTRLESPAGE